MKCIQCDSDHNDDNLIQCDGCKRCVCLACSNLTSSEARVMGLKGKRTLLFLCPPCREALFQVPKLIQAYDSVREEIDEIKKQLSSSPPPPPPSTELASGPLNTNNIIEEMAERERRANNVILVGVPESASDETAARNSHDVTLVKEILSTTTDNAVLSTRIVRLLRLGRRDPTKHRPIKVVLESRQDAVRILKNKAKAKKEVRIYDEKTPIQRNELKELRERLKSRLEKGETDLTIKYVNGVPKITKLKN